MLNYHNPRIPYRYFVFRNAWEWQGGIVYRDTESSNTPADSEQYGLGQLTQRLLAPERQEGPRRAVDGDTAESSQMKTFLFLIVDALRFLETKIQHRQTKETSKKV